MREDGLLPELPGVDGDEFTSGDVRAVENPGLASMHTIFVREHNRIASVLNVMQPQLSDEELYQMTRRQSIMQSAVLQQLFDVFTDSLQLLQCYPLNGSALGSALKIEPLSEGIFGIYITYNYNAEQKITLYPG